MAVTSRQVGTALATEPVLSVLLYEALGRCVTIAGRLPGDHPDRARLEKRLRTLRLLHAVAKAEEQPEGVWL